MKLVIIESPYAGEVERNVAYAKRALLDSVLVRGEAPIASHLLFTQPDVLNDNLGGERSKGIQAGLEWQRVADVIAFYIDYGWSPGMADALQRAEDGKREIEFRKIGQNP